MAVTGINEYTRFMVEAFNELRHVPVPTAFQAAFFGIPENGGLTVFSQDSKTIEIDIIRARGRTLAQLVNRGTSSDDASRLDSQTEAKFTNLARAWPLAETYGHINSTELLDRSPGETPYDAQTRQDRLTMKAQAIHVEAITQQLTLVEFLARQSLLTGQHPAILGTTDSGLIYDFFRDANNFITVGTVWSDVAADIMGDIDDGIDQIQQNAFLHGEYGIIVGGDAFAGIKGNTAITAVADNRRYLFAELGGDIRELPTKFHRYRDNGLNPRGYLETDKGRKVWIFTYDLTFIDNFTTPGTDTVTQWMPLDQALIFHPDVRCDRFFGPPDRMPMSEAERQWHLDMFGFNLSVPPMPAQIKNPQAFDPRMFYCDAYIGPDKKAVVIRTQSAPIMPTTQTDGFVTLDGLT